MNQRRNSDKIKYKIGAVLIISGIGLFLVLDFMDSLNALDLKIGRTRISVPTLFILSGLLNILPIGQWLQSWRKR